MISTHVSDTKLFGGRPEPQHRAMRAPTQVSSTVSARVAYIRELKEF